MSVITPILDTLLHDVLGRRMIAPVLRNLDEVVTPVRPTTPLNAGPHEPVPDIGGTRLLDAPRTPAAADTRPTAGIAGQPGEAGQARLSPVAWAIADVLGRFPAPPSTLRVLTPLIPEPVTVPPALLATLLQSSVSDSGLFYEAHLARWYRGLLPLAQLRREPQMNLPEMLRAPAAQDNTAGARTVAGTSYETARVHTAQPATLATSPDSPVAAAGSQIVAAGLVGATAESTMDAAAETQRALEISETLQGIVRHQLELLAVPVLRWEGEVWAGIFMQLIIALPDAPDHGSQKAEGGNDDVIMESEVLLELHGFGSLQIKLGFHGERLELTLCTNSSLCLQRLEAGREALAARLRRCGFNVPVITMHMLPALINSD